MTDESLKIVVISDEDADLAALGEASGLTRSEEDDVQDLFLDPITAAVLIGGALVAARFVLHVIDVYRGGVEINLTVKPPTVKRNKEVPFGYVVTLTADGKVDVNTKDEPKDAIERMVESILKLPVDATVSTVKAAIEAAKQAAPATTTSPTQTTPTTSPTSS
jgi:hypothetical protein